MIIVTRKTVLYLLPLEFEAIKNWKSLPFDMAFTKNIKSSSSLNIVWSAHVYMR